MPKAARIRLVTERLELVAGDGPLGRAEMASRKALGDLLEARVPQEWPPPLNDAASLAFFTEYAEANPDAAGWAMWYFLLRTQDGSRIAVGNGGFRGRPDASGRVEVGYSVLDAYQRNGYATEAVRALVEWAFAQVGVEGITAHTLPELAPSIRVLGKCGFELVGPGAEEGTILFERRRSPGTG